MPLPPKSARRQTGKPHQPEFLRKYFFVVAAVNIAAVAYAAVDGGWGAFGIAIIYGPATNGVLALVGLLVAPYLKSEYPEYSTGEHITVSLALPAAAIFIDWVLISSMGLHGC